MFFKTLFHMEKKVSLVIIMSFIIAIIGTRLGFEIYYLVTEHKDKISININRDFEDDNMERILGRLENIDGTSSYFDSCNSSWVQNILNISRKIQDTYNSVNQLKSSSFRIGKEKIILNYTGVINSSYTSIDVDFYTISNSFYFYYNVTTDNFSCGTDIEPQSLNLTKTIESYYTIYDTLYFVQHLLWKEYSRFNTLFSNAKYWSIIRFIVCLSDGTPLLFFSDDYIIVT